MRTVETEEARSARIVAEEDEVLAENADLPWLATSSDFTRYADRLPVTTHERAAWRFRSDPREQVVQLLL